MENERKRVLQVNIDNDGGNGAFALVRYLYSYLSEDFIFDYFTMGIFRKDIVYEDIIRSGGICFSANLRRNKFVGHLKLPFVFYKFLKSNNYETVHIHSEVAYKHFLYSIAARFAKVKIIIIHSHSCDIDGSYKGIKLLLHNIFRKAVNRTGTFFLACSSSAATWMFTDKTLKSNKFCLLHNGINPSKYKYSEQVRSRLRRELNVEKKVVIGHVGALKKVKNQVRLLEIIHDISNENYILILIGDGDDKDFLIRKAIGLGIKHQVLFLGNRTDVSDLLQAMDVFVFPSLFEGVPMALIEAQAVGLPVIASDSINRDILINDNVFFESLNSDNSVWIERIKKAQSLRINEAGFFAVEKTDYNIKYSANELRKIYND